jgi:hypothetical protein
VVEVDIFKEIRGKCRKKNPTSCRLHGKVARERLELLHAVRVQQREKREKEIQAAFNQKAQEDFQSSWKLRTESNGATSVSVYRSGVPSAPTERGVEKPYYERCDSYIPDSRQGRMTGVFCAPTLGGAARWVRGNDLANIEDIEVREIRIDIDNTYVYLVHDWERASSIDTPEMYQKFWKNGMTMRQYMELSQKEPNKYDPREYELLVPEEEIISVKPVSSNRVIQRAYDSHDDLTKIFKSIAKEKQVLREYATV